MEDESSIYLLGTEHFNLTQNMLLEILFTRKIYFKHIEPYYKIEKKKKKELTYSLKYVHLAIVCKPSFHTAGCAVHMLHWADLQSLF